MAYGLVVCLIILYLHYSFLIVSCYMQFLSVFMLFSNVHPPSLQHLWLHCLRMLELLQLRTIRFVKRSWISSEIRYRVFYTPFYYFQYFLISIAWLIWYSYLIFPTILVSEFRNENPWRNLDYLSHYSL